jgi:serine/threonine protein kinase
VLLEVAQAAAHLHQHGLVHGDLRPEKVLLRADPASPFSFTTKLADCGLTQALGQLGSGSIAHVAPELLELGGSAGAAADVYAFGILMWEVYTGQRAYEGASR